MEGFGEHGIDAGVAELPLSILRSPSGNDQDRKARLMQLRGTGHIPTGDVGHAQVSHDDIVSGPLNRADRIRSIVENVHPVSGILQRLRYYIEDRMVVVDQKETQSGRLLWRGRRW